ncbi:uncharacterized protein LOC110828070 [Zootermopsis nevadensis]|uniref:uncharacterized protein LOC110828070 n=1 Tax=Zootermopsis nevadensis TaxID=136037 RepID=UPI000B8E83D5|nr:uncharacterized protein LOC110828070 [Zootermopsis nevadensis]
MASSAAPTASSCGTERSCLCGTVNASSPSSLSSAQGSQHSSSSVAKCKICRTKPKFCFLRGQRSFDLGQQGPSSAGHVLVSAGPARSKEAEAIRDTTRTPPHARRARSAERFEGLRINERTGAGLPRQTSLQISVNSNGISGDRPPDYSYPELPPVFSPPPPYEVAMGKMGHPPSYEEYLAQRLQHQQQQIATNSTSQPPPLPPRNATKPSRNPSPPRRWPQQPSGSSTSHGLQQQSFCNCSKCKTGSVAGGRGGGLRVNLPVKQEDMMTIRGLAETPRHLRVMLPPEIAQQSTSSHEHCPCSKCQSRYGTYDDSNGNNDLMFSLDSTPALQGVLSDGLICSVM